MNLGVKTWVRGRFMVMVTISFIIPVRLLEQLDTLVRNENYPNRSKIIRIAIRDLLKDRTPPFSSIESLRKYHHHYYYHKNTRSSAQRISLKAPKELKKELEKLVNQRVYPSKSEAIRVSILSFLKREIPEKPKKAEYEAGKPIEPEEIEKEIENGLRMNNK